ncbi:hypothetical protein [Aminobacter sp. SR38]
MRSRSLLTCSWGFSCCIDTPDADRSAHAASHRLICPSHGAEGQSGP